MNYQNIRKQYYIDRDNWDSYYQKRFNNDAAIHLDFDIKGNPAFFVITPEVTALALSILSKDKSIALLSNTLPGVAKDQYTKRCLIDEIVLTNNIEGVHSSRKEIGEALAILEGQAKQKRGSRVRYIGLVNKYRKLKSGDPVALKTCQDIRSIYDELVLKEVVAEDPKNAPDGTIFRRAKTAVHSVTDKILHEGAFPETKIIELVEKSLAFLYDQSIPLLFRICIFHYMLEYIHPFYDGNGRLGRFIVSYLISKEMEPLTAYRISETIHENRSKYYDAFKLCNDPLNKGDLTPFLIMMLEMIDQAASELYTALQEKSRSWGTYCAEIESIPGLEAKPLQLLCSLLIQAALFSEHGITKKELLLHTKVSNGTLKKYLDTISEKELLITGRNGREKVYQLNTKALDELVGKK